MPAFTGPGSVYGMVHLAGRALPSLPSVPVLHPPVGMPGWRVPFVGGGAINEEHLAWKTTTVGGRRANYGVAGDGLPVLFLHGWGLGQHSYKRALKRLVRMGCRVYAPAMPGFGGTVDLPQDEVDLEGYAAWVAGFLDAVGEQEAVFVIGHSFGGAVATQFAHDNPDRVNYLVLINAVGGGTWLRSGSRVRSLAERPLWDWLLAFPLDVFPFLGAARLGRVVIEDALPNLVRNPLGMWRAVGIARAADLTAELRELKASRLPIVALHGDRDSVIPKASFDALCAAIDAAGVTVSGHHSWLLADPDAFGEVLANSVEVARVAREFGLAGAGAPPAPAAPPAAPPDDPRQDPPESAAG
jgi:pimeloyl-ACP methyl ester carboxylesterase